MTIETDVSQVQLNRRVSIERRKVSELSQLVVLQLVLTVVLVLFAVPLLWMLFSSLKASTEVFQVSWIPERPRWQNYVDVFEFVPFGRFLFNSAIVVIFAVIGTVISSALVASVDPNFRF
ncbi:hypothetical protein KFU94_19010 [Chloroflexi bacterium TSY]|nr:hypothetical protein [Chloroflexi bacterium TSY]